VLNIVQLDEGKRLSRIEKRGMLPTRHMRKSAGFTDGWQGPIWSSTSWTSQLKQDINLMRKPKDNQPRKYYSGKKKSKAALFGVGGFRLCSPPPKGLDW